MEGEVDKVSALQMMFFSGFFLHLNVSKLIEVACRGVYIKQIGNINNK